MEWMNASLLPSIRKEMDDTFKMFVVCTCGARNLEDTEVLLHVALFKGK